MLDDVNKQITDSSSLENELVLGHAIAVSHGVTLQSSAHAFSLLMLNAVAVQQSSAQTANAAVAASCAEIIRAGASAAEAGPLPSAGTSAPTN